VYRQTFDLTGYDPSTAVLSLKMASDNSSWVMLNGMDVNVAVIQADISDTSVFEKLHPFTITSGFVPGVNTLDIVVHNDYLPTGLLMELSGTADSVVAPAVTLASAIARASSTAVSGGLTSTEPGKTFTIDFYSGTSATPPAEPGDPIGSLSATTDAGGLASFSTELPLVLPTGSYVFARATPAGGGPGELSTGVPVQGLADLSATYLASGSTPVAGDPYALAFRVSNAGPSIATGVTLDALLPDGGGVIAAIASDGQVAYPSGGAALSIPQLSPGESTTLTIWIRPASASTFRVIAAAKADQSDPIPGDETAVATLTAIAPPVRPDLSVAFIASASAPTAGSDFAATFRVTNTAQAAASNVVLHVRTPAGLAVMGAFGSTGSVSLADGLATLAIPSLASGESATVTLTVRAAVAGDVAITAYATSDSPDAQPQDDSSQAVVTVTPAPLAGPGPVVVSLRRIGYHRQLTQVVLSFDQPLDPGRASDLGNYQILLAGRDGRFQTADDRRIALTLAAYNAEARAVALIPSRRLPLRQPYQVVATGQGPRGIANLRGGALNSGPDGTAGLPYRALVRGFGPIGVSTSLERRQ
jgi:hypothetical protein